jgi:hypothetical protein
MKLMEQAITFSNGLTTTVSGVTPIQVIEHPELWRVFGVDLDPLAGKGGARSREERSKALAEGLKVMAEGCAIADTVGHTAEWYLEEIGVGDLFAVVELIKILSGQYASREEMQAAENRLRVFRQGQGATEDGGENGDGRTDVG